VGGWVGGWVGEDCLSREMCVAQSGGGCGCGLRQERGGGKGRRKVYQQATCDWNPRRRRRRRRTARGLPCDLCMFPDTTTLGVKEIRVSDPYPHIQ
jgi:hypothetical protein